MTGADKTIEALGGACPGSPPEATDKRHLYRCLRCHTEPALSTPSPTPGAKCRECKGLGYLDEHGRATDGMALDGAPCPECTGQSPAKENEHG